MVNIEVMPMAVHKIAEVGFVFNLPPTSCLLKSMVLLNPHWVSGSMSNKRLAGQPIKLILIEITHVENIAEL